MNRDEAMTIVLAEAFAEKGIVMLAYDCRDPGRQRMETLISAINFLAEDLSGENHFDRQFVSALFALATGVPSGFGHATMDSGGSLYLEIGNLIVAITELIEHWDNWPNENEVYDDILPEPSEGETTGSEVDDEFMGYRIGDISYCVMPDTDQLFPVRVVRLGFNLIEVEPIDAKYCETICSQFLLEESNRGFRAPVLPPAARFGGADERPVNSDRASGPELRLLAAHYGSKTFQLIKERHASDPARWPLPTGLIYQRWFNDADSDEY